MPNDLQQPRPVNDTLYPQAGHRIETQCDFQLRSWLLRPIGDGALDHHSYPLADIVSVGKAIEAEGRSFCSDTCAQHHAGGAGCDHAGCTCQG